MPKGVYQKTEEHKRNISKALMGKKNPWTVIWNKKFKSSQTKGDKNPNWKGGKYFDKSGYVYIWKPNHHFHNKRGYIFEHRFITEKCLNRYLTKKEVIHHINNIKNDNRPKNLYLFSSNFFHYKFHKLKNKPNLISNISQFV